jgi:DNA-binding XRE family transcriptional regulator
MSQSDLAMEVGVAKRTIIRHEDEARTDVRRGDVQRKIREVLEEDHGVEFIFADGKKGEGVRLRRIS